MTEFLGCAILLAVGSIVVYVRKWPVLKRIKWTLLFPAGFIWLAYDVYRMQDKISYSGGLLMLATAMIGAVLWAFETPKDGE